MKSRLQLFFVVLNFVDGRSVAAQAVPMRVGT